MTAGNAELTARLRQHVDRLAGLIGPRYLGKPESIRATQTLIERELTEMGYESRRESYVASGHETANIIVEIPGTRHPEQILIVGAHYDTVHTTPGADDNASAVAALLEIARMLVGQRFRKTVRLVFFACEEPPHYHLDEMGSQIHSRGCRTREEQIIGMLCLEMLGFYTTVPNSQQLPPKIPKWLRWLFPSRGDFLASVANPRSIPLLLSFRRGFKRAVRFPLFSVPLPEKVEEIRRSDHACFWDQGYQALMLTDTSFLRNPHYHQPTDTPDTLDYERLTDVTVGICGAIRHIGRRTK